MAANASHPTGIDYVIACDLAEALSCRKAYQRVTPRATENTGSAKLAGHVCFAHSPHPHPAVRVLDTRAPFPCVSSKQGSSLGAMRGPTVITDGKAVAGQAPAPQRPPLDVSRHHQPGRASTIWMRGILDKAVVVAAHVGADPEDTGDRAWRAAATAHTERRPVPRF